MRLPEEVRKKFQKAGAKGGRIGAKRRVESSTPEQRKAWAANAGKASAKKRKEGRTLVEVGA